MLPTVSKWTCLSCKAEYPANGMCANCGPTMRWFHCKRCGVLQTLQMCGTCVNAALPPERLSCCCKDKRQCGECHCCQDLYEQIQWAPRRIYIDGKLRLWVDSEGTEHCPDIVSSTPDWEDDEDTMMWSLGAVF